MFKWIKQNTVININSTKHKSAGNRIWLAEAFLGETIEHMDKENELEDWKWKTSYCNQNIKKWKTWEKNFIPLGKNFITIYIETLNYRTNTLLRYNRRLLIRRKGEELENWKLKWSLLKKSLMHKKSYRKWDRTFDRSKPSLIDTLSESLKGPCMTLSNSQVECFIFTDKSVEATKISAFWYQLSW